MVDSNCLIAAGFANVKSIFGLKRLDNNLFWKMLPFSFGKTVIAFVLWSSKQIICSPVCSDVCVFS